MNKNMNGAEFVNAEVALEWSPIKVLPPGAWEKILYRDEETGTYARLVKLDQGFDNAKGVPLEHEFDELVFILAGETTFPRIGDKYPAGSLALFPTGVKHAPYSAPNGSLGIEFRHYANTAGKRSFPSREKLKGESEFINADELEWEPIKVLPPGAWEKILYRDEETGTYARLVKLDKGFENKEGVPLEHEFDELVYIVAGETTFPKLGHSYGPGSLALFPAGVKHGPYCAPNGSLGIEFRHYANKAGKRSFPSLK